MGGVDRRPCWRVEIRAPSGAEHVTVVRDVYPGGAVWVALAQLMVPAESRGVWGPLLAGEVQVSVERTTTLEET